MKGDTEERFAAKVNKIPGGCWEWSACIHVTTGYGLIRWEGKTQKAHRVSWKINNGEIPAGSYVLHACDNRKCVNPDHLSLGDHVQNMRDAVERKRFPTGDAHHTRRNPEWMSKGEKHPSAKLKRSDVFKILWAHRAGATITEIAEAYPVHRQQVARIVSGERWKKEYAEFRRQLAEIGGDDD